MLPDERLVVPVGELAPLAGDEERLPLEGDSVVEGGEGGRHVGVGQERLHVQPPQGGSGGVAGLLVRMYIVSICSSKIPFRNMNFDKLIKF